jgi:hypothetical protein
MKRGQYPGAFKGSSNSYAAKVWIDGEVHYLGSFRTREAAAAYVRLVEGRYPNRLRRPRGTLARDRKAWRVLAPRPRREPLGRFNTRWEAEVFMRQIGLRS